MDNTVIVIDDHDIVRLGLETLIAGSPHLRLLGSAASLRDGLALIERHQPALVITDMGTGDSSGLATVRAVLAAQGPRATLVLSMHDEMLYGEPVMALGASGYLMKERASAEIVPAALAALKGELWMSPRLNARLLSRTLKRHRPDTTEATDGERSLTLREREVLDLVHQGKATKEIACALGLSARTVDIHRANIKRKLGLRSAAAVIASGMRRT
ncbi:MAG: response regulator transcription factor [Comamonadaceae bacterium]|jgi:DNA-binding NarL/FixJ family response regulator|nr:response regulator transcription factor [Comamonadaceae bacterium]